MRWLPLVVLCGCNSIFGIASTQNGDAARQYFDAGIDGLPSCPPPGAPLKFLPTFHQVLVRDCVNYTMSSAGIAIAQCSTDNAYDVEVGPTDVSLAPAVGLQSAHPGATSFNPRVSPDGQTAYLEVAEEFVNTVYEIESFQRNVDGSWTQGANLEIPFTLPNLPSIGTMTTSPNAHVIAQAVSSILEYRSDDAGTFSLVQTYSNADLGVATAFVPTMTIDGLHMVFAGSRIDTNADAVFYAARASIDDRFGTASVLDGVPTTVSDPYMTDDCERLYFSGLQSIFYEQREQD